MNTVKTIKTELGIIEVSEKDIISFEEGLLGFESITEYVLVNHDESGFIMTLQPIETTVPEFIVLDPFAIYKGYSPKVSKADMEYFNCKDCDSLKYLVIAVVGADHLETVANLKSPIVIDPSTQKAKQIILENTDYPIQYKIFENKEVK